ncbi:uncharacterized protein LOC109122031 [Vitis vinifera]|nr:uncharacterized protein LOC109122031 [Vitis vinifera]|eukprot:XP_019073655.1 PREDICTED: uncharacterized protein LOC109122031 [Vitis vinifera]
MVEKILQLFSMAIYDTDGQNMNIVLKAVENRRSHIYDFLLNSNLPHREIAFHAVDEQGNSALHLAGKLPGYRHFQHIPTSMLHMQWEVKWYQYVQNSLLPDFVVKNNRTGNSPDKIFQAEHRELEDESKQWLNSTSNSCSFIAALIATVAFASTASVPGGLQWLNSTSNSCSFIAALIATVAFASSAGVKQDTGSIFGIAPLVALFCSVISLLIFCAIFISKDEDKDFTTNLPRKFLFGLTSLFISIAAMLTCFCSGNFLMLKGQLKFAAILLYALTGVVMAYFVLKHFPLFIGLLKATFRKVPERIYKEYLWIPFVL